MSHYKLDREQKCGVGMYISVMTSCIEDDAEEECILSTALDKHIQFNPIFWKKTVESLKPRWINEEINRMGMVYIKSVY